MSHGDTHHSPAKFWCIRVASLRHRYLSLSPTVLNTMAPPRRPANLNLAEDPLPPNAKSFFEVYLQSDTGRKKRVRFTLKRYNDYIRWIKTLPDASSPTYQAAQTARRYYTYYNGAGATLKEGLYRLSQKGKPELKVSCRIGV